MLMNIFNEGHNSPKLSPTILSQYTFCRISSHSANYIPICWWVPTIFLFRYVLFNLFFASNVSIGAFRNSAYLIWCHMLTVSYLSVTGHVLTTSLNTESLLSQNSVIFLSQRENSHDIFDLSVTWNLHVIITKTSKVNYLRSCALVIDIYLSVYNKQNCYSNVTANTQVRNSNKTWVRICFIKHLFC